MWNSAENQGLKTNLKRNIAKRILLYFFIVSLITLLLFQNWNINLNGLKQFKNNITNLFNISNASTYQETNESSNLFLLSLKFLWISMKYTLVGTFLGFIFSIITSYFSSEFNNNKYLKNIIKGLLLIISSIPELLYLYLFSQSFNLYFALTFIMFFFSWIWLHKYLVEVLNTCDKKPYNIALIQGKSKTKAFFLRIYPRIKNKYFERFLYSFESNLRWGSLISLIGLPGIALLIKYAQEAPTTFKQFLIPALVLITFLFVLELINIGFKKYIFETKTKKYTSKRVINFRSIFLRISFLVLSCFSIYVLINLKYKIIYSANTLLKLKELFIVDFSVFKINNELSNNLYCGVFQSLSFALLSASISILLVILFIRFSNIHLNKKYVYLPTRFFILFFRAIPLIVIFYIWNPLFVNPILLLIFSLAIHKALSIAKQLVQSIDSIDKKVIDNLKMQMWNNNKIYFKFIVFYLRGEFISLFILNIELAFRSSITYALISGDSLILGSKINNIFNERILDISTYTPYLWTSFLTIVLLNLFSSYINKRLTKKAA